MHQPRWRLRGVGAPLAWCAAFCGVAGCFPSFEGLSDGPGGGAGGTGDSGTSDSGTTDIDTHDAAARDAATTMCDGQACTAGPGTALRFDGNQVLRPGASVADDFTIELWMKTTTVPAGDQWYYGAALYQADNKDTVNDFGMSQAGNKIAFGTGKPDVSAFSTSSVATGMWTHVAATREKSTSTVQIFINGTREASLATGNTTSLVDAQPPWIGGQAPHGTVAQGFVGTLDELRVWNVVRTGAEIADSMHSRLIGTEPGLVGYWRLDDGAGLVAADSSRTGNPGTLGGGYLNLYPTWVASDAPIK